MGGATVPTPSGALHWAEGAAATGTDAPVPVPAPDGGATRVGCTGTTFGITFCDPADWPSVPRSNPARRGGTTREIPADAARSCVTRLARPESVLS